MNENEEKTATPEEVTSDLLKRIFALEKEVDKLKHQVLILAKLTHAEFDEIEKKIE